MNYILDTHTLLWFLRGEEKFSEAARKVILDSSAKKFISIASLWEIAIKNRIGKLPLKKGIADIFEKIEANGFGLLEVDRKYIEIYSAIPLIHRDPFDGIIVATAMAEQMTLITADEDIQKYDINWIW